MIEQAHPFILPREAHPLSRKDIDSDVLKILYRLHHHGFLGYLVGGCVRDLLLGKTPKDFDVATDAHPQQIRDLFRNSRLIGRRFRLAHVYFKGGKFIEVSTFRKRSEFEEEGAPPHPQSDNTFGTPAEDAFRRDLTINGVFYNIADFSLVDYVGGLEDLRQGIIRCIGDPEEKFLQDPVRMIRVIRHAARTGFAIEEKTYQSMIRHIERVSLCSPARVRDEFLREMREGGFYESLRLMMETGMLPALFPPFRPLLNNGAHKTYLLRIASELEALRLGGNHVSDDFVLSLFLSPLVSYYCPMDEFPPGRRGQDLFQEKLHLWVLDTLGPLQFPRQMKERVSHLLSAQRIFREFLPQKKLPFRLAHKSYFLEARRLFEAVARLDGKAVEDLSWEIQERRTSSKRRKRTRRRKRSHPPSSVGSSRDASLEKV
jgi:poly(A) polymerase